MVTDSGYICPARNSGCSQRQGLNEKELRQLDQLYCIRNPSECSVCSSGLNRLLKDIESLRRAS